MSDTSEKSLFPFWSALESILRQPLRQPASQPVAGKLNYRHNFLFLTKFYYLKKNSEL